MDVIGCCICILFAAFSFLFLVTRACGCRWTYMWKAVRENSRSSIGIGCLLGSLGIWRLIFSFSVPSAAFVVYQYPNLHTTAQMIPQHHIVPFPLHHQSYLSHIPHNQPTWSKMRIKQANLYIQQRGGTIE